MPIVSPDGALNPIRIQARSRHIIPTIRASHLLYSANIASRAKINQETKMKNKISSWHLGENVVLCKRQYKSQFCLEIIEIRQKNQRKSFIFVLLLAVLDTVRHEILMPQLPLQHVRVLQRQSWQEYPVVVHDSDGASGEVVVPFVRQRPDDGKRTRGARGRFRIGQNRHSDYSLVCHRQRSASLTHLFADCNKNNERSTVGVS